MREVKKKKDRAALALVLCFCVVALTSIFAVKASLNKFNAGESDLEISKNTKTETIEKEAAAKTPVVDSKDSEKPEQQTETKAEPEPAADYIAPVKGKVQKPYSMDMPIYSKTLDQYMTHPGIDIAASLSTEVKAVASGTVTKVGEDDRYGMTVEITHGNGIISIYSNLASQGLAETGDVVKQGQVIGAVGETALFETLEESHLHLEMTKDSALVNPADYIKGL